jgi:hypothetical protein
MINARVLIVSAVTLAASIRPGAAGPCTAEIDQLQAQLDAKLDATAGAGPYGRESRGADLGRQPTPGSIARAEERLGEGSGLGKALAILQRARDLDRAEDRAACQQALAEARRAVGP